MPPTLQTLLLAFSTRNVVDETQQSLYSPAMANDALLKAVAIFEGQAALARRLTEITGKDVSQQRIWNILNRGQDIPAELVIPIEKATAHKVQEDGKGVAVTRHDLRPDLYPNDESADANRPLPAQAAQ